MDDKLKQQKRNLAWSKYAVRINGWRFAGAIEPDGVTRAICAAYVTPLKECEALTNNKSILSKTLIDEGLSTSNFLFLLVALVLGMLIALMLYKRLFFTKYIQRALREEVMLEVQTQLADYVPLEENRSNRGSPSRF